ncbi:MAG: GTP cyclohydrolase I FolE [Holosporaceae bacterium]|jgi:GTP cyclohydrolase I|nr:GTP cyclohydrolase I FolE [Holosporaceae bacterium]
MDIEHHIKGIIGKIDPDSSRLEETPARVAKVYGESFSGYGVDISSVVSKFYDSGMDDLIILKNISFESHCEHHLVPIIGTASVGYVPQGKIVGASKLARIVDCFARRLQLQERMTMEIAQALESVLEVKGAAVYLEAEHFCISHRGVKKPESKFVTRYFSGILKSDPNLRREFLESVQKN